MGGGLEVPLGEVGDVRLMPSPALRCQRPYEILVADRPKSNFIDSYKLLKCFDFILMRRAVFAWHIVAEAEKTESRSSSQINRGSCSD